MAIMIPSHIGSNPICRSTGAIIGTIVPIIAPVLLQMGFDPIWLGIMIAINLQTSFLTPPFGFALFYLRGVAPRSIKTQQIYRGVIPFVILQILMLFLLAVFPEIVITISGNTASRNSINICKITNGITPLYIC